MIIYNKSFLKVTEKQAPLIKTLTASFKELSLYEKLPSGYIQREFPQTSKIECFAIINNTAQK